MKAVKYPTLKASTKESREINKLQSNIHLLDCANSDLQAKIEQQQTDLKRVETELLIEREINKCLREFIINNS